MTAAQARSSPPSCPCWKPNDWRMSLAWPIGYGDDTTEKKPATCVDSDPSAGTYPNLWAQIVYYESGRLEVEFGMATITTSP